MASEVHAAFFSQIDWARPWLAHIRGIGEVIAQAPDWRAALNQHAQLREIHNHQGLPLRFVPQTLLPAGVAYEAFISATGQVPTRDNLHDFFNALVWLTFPATKAQLNALQAAEINKVVAKNSTDFASNVKNTRGKLRDAATIFDENAVLLISTNTELSTALRAHAWEQVFVQQRASFQKTCVPLLFGHALMEKLVAPYKAITGHMWVMVDRMETLNSLPIAIDMPLDSIDRQLAVQLQHGLTTADFSPLPVLGVPEWWERQDEMFYRDQSVFRPKRE
tara:strand:+ start:13298 stop:14131 length:834 start_codon:yes stop_codon:yes gene_type:complete